MCNPVKKVNLGKIRDFNQFPFDCLAQLKSRASFTSAQAEPSYEEFESQTMWCKGKKEENSRVGKPLRFPPGPVLRPSGNA